MAERVAMSRVLAALQERFGDVNPDVITAAVAERYQYFEGCRIRDFVPLLVERAVRDDIRRSLAKIVPDDSIG